MYRIVELGPFGSRINHGTVEDMGQIPKNFEVTRVDDGSEITTVYIEPALED